jgi:glycine cleavage system H lipoate-binding protein/NAD-dependent dihydropyrimidine dehydrogenase PreA subunit
MPQVKMKIDGREVGAEQGEPLLTSIRALGIDVPTLCQMDGLEPHGACRLCMVEVRRGGRTRLVTSCNYPAAEGLEVRTRTPEVLKDRAVNAELLLARCPDVGIVKEIAASLGVTRSRFKTTEPSDCVMCGLCVRACDEIVGASAIGFQGRGATRAVGKPFLVHPDACIGCGVCTHVCPTGAMQMEAETREWWRKELGGQQRLCRYSRMGLLSYKVCPNNLECSRCEVDQRFFDEFGTHPLLALAPSRSSKPRQVGHFFLVEDRHYFQGHTWAKAQQRQEQNRYVRVGLDDFAQRVVGDISGAELVQRPGDKVQRGDPALVVSNDGRQATLLFPVSGTILRVNPAVEDDPALINEDCYDRGWVYTLAPRSFDEDAYRLVDAGEAAAWIQTESDRLFQVLDQSGDAGAVSEGGDLLPNFSRALDDESWDRVAGMFRSQIDGPVSGGSQRR